jgi:flagellar hook-basal body complex protein FliE
MLSKKDKEWTKQTLAEEVRGALTVKVRMERRRDLATGQPLATPVIEVTDLYLPAFLSEYVPYLEGAMRGVQETSDHTRANVDKSAETIKAVAEVMIKFEKAMTSLVALAVKAEKMAELPGAVENGPKDP